MAENATMTTTVEEFNKAVDAKVAERVEIEMKRAKDELARGANPFNFYRTSGGATRIEIGVDHTEKLRQTDHLRSYLIANMEKNYEKQRSLMNENSQYYKNTRANFNEGTSGQGGALVPIYWSQQILTGVEQYGFARKIAKMFPMQSLSHYFNSGGSVTGGFVAEANAPTPVDASSFFTQTTLTAKRLAAAFLTSRQLLEDATPEYMDFMTTELARYIASQEDVAIFNGSGSGANPTGLIGTSGVNVKYLGNASNSGKTTRAGVSWLDFARLRNSINTSLAANAVFVVPQVVYGNLCTEVTSTTTNQPVGALMSLFQPIDFPDGGINALNGNMYQTPTGKKLIVVPDACFPSDAVTTACALYGDFSQFAIFGTRQDMELNTYKEGYNGTVIAGTNQWAIEMQERIGFCFPVASAFTVLKTSTT